MEQSRSSSINAGCDLLQTSFPNNMKPEKCTRSLVGDDPGTHHHPQGKSDFNRFFRTILATGSAVPALFRIFYERLSFLVMHVDYVQRTGIFTGTATGTKVFSNHGRHLVFSFQS
jgi:hypothetical protein